MSKKVKLLRLDTPMSEAGIYGGSVRDLTPGKVYDAVQYGKDEQNPDTGDYYGVPIWVYVDDAGDTCTSIVSVHKGKTLRVVK